MRVDTGEMYPSPSPMPPMTPYPRYRSQSWPVAMPRLATQKPETQNVPATTMALRGPAFSTQVPPTAAERPSTTIARENTHPTARSPAPKRCMNGVLKTLSA